MNLEKEINGINVYKELCKSNIIRLDGEVNLESATHVCTLLTILDDMNVELEDENGEKYYKPIWLYINSPGGVCYDGLAIIDTMRSIKSPVFVVCCGIAMSMGAAILSCGDRRFVTENSTIMLHEVSSGAKGKLSTMEEEMAEAKRLNDLLSSIISANCNKSKKVYDKEVRKRDYFLTAADALTFGIVDEILPKSQKFVHPQYINKLTK